jgi:CheY-like chemotaxis protein
MDKTILIVEDQDDLRLLVRLSLKSLGRVLLASSAAQGSAMATAGWTSAAPSRPTPPPAT